MAATAVSHYIYGQDKCSETRGNCQIEHGFLLYTTGLRVDRGQFSQDIVGTIVGEYADIALRLSDRRWNKIMKLCGTHCEEQKLSLKVNLRAMYEPSSPTKGSDDE